MVDTTFTATNALYARSVNGCTEENKELRCAGCGKLLAEKAAPGTVIVCSRCKTRNEADV